MSRLVLEGKSDLNEPTPSRGKKWLKGAGGGRDQLPRHCRGQVGWGPWPGTLGPGGRWGQEGQHYCHLQRGQGREVPRGHTSTVFRPLGLICVSRAAGPHHWWVTKGAGGAGHLGGDTAYSPKPLNVIRISLYYGICKKQRKLSVHKFWIQILSQISSYRLNARMSRYFHL